MKKTRYIPYGYTVRNGKTIIDQTEAEVIRHIFDEYIGGASLQEIADYLTHQKIPYAENTVVWGKATVARIIHNTKYIGNDEYEPIIKESTFTTASECKNVRQKNTSGRQCPALAVIRSKIRCAECGKEMIQIINNANTIRTSWTCINAGCQMNVYISNGDLIEKINVLMHRIIENNILMSPKPQIQVQEDPSVCQLQTKLQNENEKANPSEDILLDTIRQIATAQYDAFNTNNPPTTDSSQPSGNNYDLIDTIQLKRNGRIELTTKVDIMMRKGEEDG